MVVRVRDLAVASTRSGELILDGVDLDAPAGQVTVLVGASGSGKSTLLRALLDGLDRGRRRIRGEFELDGVSFFAQPPPARRRLLGDRLTWIPQDVGGALAPALRVIDQVAEVVRYHRAAPWSEARERAAEALRAGGIPSGSLRAFPHELSGGQRQRVLVAMAMVLRPSAILADEPTTALDNVATHAVLGRLRQAAREGASVIWVTHEMSWVRAFADRVLFLHEARVVLGGPANEVFDHDHPSWRRFLAAR